MNQIQESDSIEAKDLSQVQIRLAKPEDASAILEMLGALIDEGPKMNQTPAWAESGEAKSVVAFHIERNMALVAEIDKTIIGHIGWRIGYSRPPEVAIRYAEVESIFIHHDFRGNEVAKMLIAGFLRECSAKAISITRVSARPDPATISLFESCGFVEQRRLMVNAGTAR